MRCTFQRGRGLTCHHPAEEGKDRCAMHTRGSRSTSPPPALKLANALGVQLEAGKPDHELLEKIAEQLTPKLAEAFRDGYRAGRVDGGNSTLGDHEPALTSNPIDGSPLS